MTSNNITAADRAAFDEAIVNMTIGSSPYSKNYIFYLHMISQCKVVFDKALPAAAGVAFCNDHYKLCINPSEVVAEGVDEKGNKVIIQGICKAMPLIQRIGVLKHEMLHICNNHVGRKGDRDHDGFNVAADCALNQDIDRDHLPDYAIYPDNLIVEPGTEVPLYESAEVYYELLKKQKKKKKGEGKGKGNCTGDDSEKPSAGNSQGTYVNHDTWNDSEGDAGIQKEIAKKMVEKAAEETQKSAGKLPADYSQMIKGLTENKDVNWKQVLRWIVGNKKVNSRKTLMRRDRRLPNFNWIKGRVKDRVFELAVISDVSGSVSDKALVKLWSVIINICKTYRTPVTMIQVDTNPGNPEKLTTNTKVVERKHCGGTYLSPAIEKLREHKIKFDALVITTDGYLFDNDIQPFENLNVPVIWLIEKDGVIMDQMNSGKMRAIQLTK